MTSAERIIHALSENLEKQAKYAPGMREAGYLHPHHRPQDGSYSGPSTWPPKKKPLGLQAAAGAAAAQAAGSLAAGTGKPAGKPGVGIGAKIAPRYKNPKGKGGQTKEVAPLPGKADMKKKASMSNPTGDKMKDLFDRSGWKNSDWRKKLPGKTRPMPAKPDMPGKTPDYKKPLPGKGWGMPEKMERMIPMSKKAEYVFEKHAGAIGLIKNIGKKAIKWAQGAKAKYDHSVIKNTADKVKKKVGDIKKSLTPDTPNVHPDNRPGSFYRTSQDVLRSERDRLYK